jgi:UDP-glucuronate decarboxylase
VKKVLVTGGAGFLGSHLCEYLLSKKESVICLDNLSTGSEQNISHLVSNKYFKFVNQDVLFPLNFQCDQIYNLASPASPIKYQLFPIETIKTNIIGSINALELAKKNNAKILQASTSEIYGDSLISPQDESYFGNVNPIGERSCYNESKRCAESLFFSYKRKNQLDIRVCRIFNTFGPRMSLDDGRVISSFIGSSLMNKNIVVYGDGMQTRSFCYVLDMIKGMYMLMNFEGNIDIPVNLGSENEMTIMDLAEKIITLTNSSSEITFSDLPKDDPLVRRPDISQAKKILNWEPKITLDEGIVATVKHLNDYL